MYSEETLELVRVTVEGVSDWLDEAVLPEVEETPEEVAELSEVTSELEELVTEVGPAMLLDGFPEAEV